MKYRNRYNRKVDLDLIGFLDILSSLTAIILLILIVLVLSLRQEVASIERIQIQTQSGKVINKDVVLIDCDGQQLNFYHAGQDQPFETLPVDSPELTQQLTRDRRYLLAVRPACFTNLGKLVAQLEASGVNFGYEPFKAEEDIKI